MHTLCLRKKTSHLEQQFSIYNNFWYIYYSKILIFFSATNYNARMLRENCNDIILLIIIIIIWFVKRLTSGLEKNYNIFQQTVNISPFPTIDRKVIQQPPCTVPLWQTEIFVKTASSCEIFMILLNITSSYGYWFWHNTSTRQMDRHAGHQWPVCALHSYADAVMHKINQNFKINIYIQMQQQHQSPVLARFLHWILWCSMEHQEA